jgi:hypothetical protein
MFAKSKEPSHSGFLNVCKIKRTPPYLVFQKKLQRTGNFHRRDDGKPTD